MLSKSQARWFFVGAGFLGFANIGMTAVAGVSQVYLERKAGMDFMAVQESMETHFFGLIMTACLLSLGIGLYIWNFIQYGLPSDEAVEAGGAYGMPAPARVRNERSFR